MSAFVKFVPAAAENAQSDGTPAKVAKAAKVEPETPGFSRISGFSSPAPGNAESESAPPKLSPDALQAERERADRAREERREWGDDLCRRVSAGVAHQSPKGLGSWPQAWRIVAAADARLLALLATFEETGEEGDKRAAVHAAEDLAIAWEKAAKAWEARKR